MDYENLQMIAGLSGLLLFIAIFAGVLFWVLRPGAKESFDENARIPFKEDGANGHG